ncbi:exopolysaccharide transport protein family [Rhizobium sp. RU35A]|uniref:Wzz/FepE/Etk N-terminal domain-containing protein n=1 Tax=Rhizobium sp. RU35A TaxID=1907414 RepID=UPI000953A1F5|nr:Wzz/FepE/Etk N-terminal domain-containing protein [Rhizobium sp. RU35A]SIP90363.1 exopolysaccharide transport protein family [Rhizobium sp. RU35A]
MAGVSGNQDADIDLGQLFSAVWEKRRRILLTTALAAVAAFAVSSLMSPYYKAESRLVIEARGAGLVGDGAQGANDGLLDASNVASQAQILQSADLIRAIAREMNLGARKEFDPDAYALLPDPLVLVGLKPDPLDLPAEDRILKTFRERLQVYPVEGSRVIAIEFSSKDPKLAAAIPNRLAAAYLALQSDAKRDTHSDATRWLQPEIETLRARVEAAEKKVADYRAAHGLFQSGDNTSFTTKQLADMSAELAKVRSDRASAEARAGNVRAALAAGRGTDTLSDVVGSAMIQRLKESEAGLRSQIADASTTLMDGHPRLKALRAQLAGIGQQIEAETRKILASLEGEATVARLREQQLMQQLGSLQAESSRSDEGEVGLRALEREAAVERQLLETYLARYREAASRIDVQSTPADARIVSTAIEPPEPYFPKVIPITIVAALAAFVVQVIVLILMALFSGRALRPADGEIDVSSVPRSNPVSAAPPEGMTPVAAVLPEIHTPGPVIETPRLGPSLTPQPESVGITAQPLDDANAIIASLETPSGATPPSPAEAAFEAPAVSAPVPPVPSAAVPALGIEAVRDYLLRRRDALVISVSPQGDAGSAAAVVLARALAARRRSVVLVDLTGSACPTGLMAGDARLAGITDLLCGEAAFGDTIHPDRLSEAHVIPQGTADAAEAMRAADRLTMIIDALTGAYEIVLVECGPADVRALERLMRGSHAELILSLSGASEDVIAETVARFAAAGYPDALVMTGGTHLTGTPHGRHAA